MNIRINFESTSVAHGSLDSLNRGIDVAVAKRESRRIGGMGCHSDVISLRRGNDLFQEGVAHVDEGVQSPSSLSTSRSLIGRF
jgi:hypothetical protein